MFAGDFFQDLNFFRDRGHIGQIAAIKPACMRPEIGTRCAVTLETDGTLCFASIDGRLGIGVVDGEVIEVEMREDRPITVRLLDESGEEVATETIVPWVSVPQLTMNLPEKVSYQNDRLNVRISVKNVAQIDAAYRCHGGDEWIRVNADDYGFSVPVAPQEGSIEVKVELRSPHAQWSPRATILVQQMVQICHPSPECGFATSSLCVRRFDQNVLAHVTSRWISKIEIEFDGFQQTELVRAGESSELALEIDTSDIGMKRVDVHLHDLSGAVMSRTFEVVVLPRTTQFDVVQCADGSVEFAVMGATQLQLVIPSRFTALDLDDHEGILTHGFQFSTAAYFSLIDDAGNSTQHDLVLVAPIQVWTELPKFKQTQGWRV